MGKANIVFTGFMGTGKTTVGRLVAERLGRRFVDLDGWIVENGGCEIDEIFQAEGEGRFRELETLACREVGSQRGLVIATGGGTLLDARNRDLLERYGTIVCLTCEPGELVRRLRGNTVRPLLTPGKNLAEQVEDLLARRAEAYAALPLHVDTTGQSPTEVAQSVVELLGEKTLWVRHPGGSYPVRIGQGALARLGDAMRGGGIERSAPVALVSNPTVHAYHGDVAAKALYRAGYTVEICLVPDGEANKRLSTVARLYDQLLEYGFDRQGIVVGMGGGVTTDLCGFVAATYLRGVRWVQVPTTLLAMVDASIGGKTAVNLPQGKNLVGAFWSPQLVVADPRLLTTLPEAEIRCGMAEVIKHAILADPELFAWLSSAPVAAETWWSAAAVDRLSRAMQVKIGVIEDDPEERGARVVLNLGHTAGHALEVASGHTVPHGEAVAFGMVVAARLAVRLGRLERAVGEEIEQTISRWRLPTRCVEISVDRLVVAMQHDKKRTKDGLRWILPSAIGKVECVENVSETDVRRVLAELGARSSHEG